MKGKTDKTSMKKWKIPFKDLLQNLLGTDKAFRRRGGA